MRQIGTALVLYAAENDGFNPPLVDSDDVNWDKQAILPYLPPRENRQNAVFVCPAADYKGFPNNDLSRTYASTESMIGPGNSYRIPTKRIAYDSLSGTLILFDARQDGGNRYCRTVASWNQVKNLAPDLRSGGSANTTYIDYRHGDAFHGLFADGHVATITRKQAPAEVTSIMWKGR